MIYSSTGSNLKGTFSQKYAGIFINQIKCHNAPLPICHLMHKCTQQSHDPSLDRSSHHTTAAPSLSDRLTPSLPAADWQQTLTEASGDEPPALRVNFPSLMSRSATKPNWESTTIPARQLRASQDGGFKDCFACVSSASENITTSESPLTFMQPLPPCGPEKSQKLLRSRATQTQSGRVQVQVLRPSKPLHLHFWESDLLRACTQKTYTQIDTLTHTHTAHVCLFLYLIRNPATTETLTSHASWPVFCPKCPSSNSELYSPFQAWLLAGCLATPERALAGC